MSMHTHVPRCVYVLNCTLANGCTWQYSVPVFHTGWSDYILTTTPGADPEGGFWGCAQTDHFKSCVFGVKTNSPQMNDSNCKFCTFYLPRLFKIFSFTKKYPISNSCRLNFYHLRCQEIAYWHFYIKKIQGEAPRTPAVTSRRHGGRALCACRSAVSNNDHHLPNVEPPTLPKFLDPPLYTQSHHPDPVPFLCPWPSLCLTRGHQICCQANFTVLVITEITMSTTL
jgi:hypothetical protein